MCNKAEYWGKAERNNKNIYISVNRKDIVARQRRHGSNKDALKQSSKTLEQNKKYQNKRKLMANEMGESRIIMGHCSRKTSD